MYEMLKDFIMPELVVLIPVLYLLGIALKKSQVADRHIPWILGVVSAFLSIIAIIGSFNINGFKDVLMSVFSGITQGVLCAGASVYVNQIIKQAGKNE